MEQSTLQGANTQLATFVARGHLHAEIGALPVRIAVPLVSNTLATAVSSFGLPLSKTARPDLIGIRRKEVASWARQTKTM